MSLAPASGFQSCQYRMIEIMSTDMDNLLAQNQRGEYAYGQVIDVKTKFEHIYWKQGAIETETGNKTLTLRQFENKYEESLVELASEYENKNLRQKYYDLPPEEQQNETLIRLLKNFDLRANVNWPLMHYKTADHYLHKDPDDIAATGGTNWRKYMAPRNQKILFFPELWSDIEKEEWGRKVIDGLTD